MSANPRVADYAIHPQFTDRWSPRAFTGEAIPEETLLSFFEAARWAPSAYNSQPGVFSMRAAIRRTGSASWAAERIQPQLGATRARRW
jgi:nitroreductase